MIAVLKNGVPQEQVDNLIAWLNGQDVQVHISKGDSETVLGLVGDTSKIDIELLEGLDIIRSVMRVSEPFKNASFSGVLSFGRVKSEAKTGSKQPKKS